MLNRDFFPKAVPARPTGHYAHIILLRETESYALFQTDGELNTARVPAGTKPDDGIITRITMFKRKQTTPERLVGRELLRRYGLIAAEQGKEKSTDEAPFCDYNVDFCKQCPDCIAYGFAIGDAGSEKSKVYSDTAYSLTAFEYSHETFTLNAPYESGTMSQQGVVTSRINEQDHVRPQVIFPAVITTRDLTFPLFTYVLNNVLRARRYGAQTTRTGTMTNHLIGIALTDGEIFSNLYFTQRLYDALREQGIDLSEPVNAHSALAVAAKLVPELLAEDRVVVSQWLSGAELDQFLTEIFAADEAAMQTLLKAAYSDSKQYANAHVLKSAKGKS
ncbi:type I-D CRISPR-associated protein Cas7/Csc2 [Chloroflexus islandicus]|uniref:Type I-D CRISPR-associated protein Cas7/Csc2 n=1 Tax=Chloroflexus islandicus TaxID=1707952 RepID=A0A178MEN9_9CHLR|nr:type I-D CRISPR-associated protein Cas7/Csc2 [Chloroflexus islandicus]OAN46314.1 type I-D CRISPR-associated protein Cas7/Csc2 [Chloroflexus islandicus]